MKDIKVPSALSLGRKYNYFKIGRPVWIINNFGTDNF
jgi:hypothetical protein